PGGDAGEREVFIDAGEGGADRELLGRNPGARVLDQLLEPAVGIFEDEHVAQVGQRAVPADLELEGPGFIGDAGGRALAGKGDAVAEERLAWIRLMRRSILAYGGHLLPQDRVIDDDGKDLIGGEESLQERSGVGEADRRDAGRVGEIA